MATGDGADQAYAETKRMLAEDLPDAVVRLRALAGQGHARAQFRLGLAYARGECALARDPGQAVHWCGLAAMQGHGKAQFNLGILLAQGHGVERDPVAAGHWLRLAAANGVDDAERCLDLVHDDGDGRPRSWAEAETRASVALAETGPEAGKRLRFAEYYVDPCIDVLISHLRLSRELSEDIVQQFMLELEEPLAKGEHRGRPWKRSLRERFAAGNADERNAFRPYLYRVLVNFTRDHLRRLRRPAPGTVRREPPPDLAAAVAGHAGEWMAAYARFEAAAPAESARAVSVLRQILVEAADQAAVAARHGITDRTVRSDLRLAGELLLTWLGDLPPASADHAIEAGLALLPDWLHRPVGDKRNRILLYLALVERRLADQGA